MKLLKNLYFTLSFCLLCICSLNSYSVEVESLYSASVDIVSREDEQERERAFSTAMAEVLLKNTGSRSILDTQSVRQALRNPQRYVDTRVYRSVILNEELINPVTGEIENIEREQIELEISFYESEILSLLDNNNLPLWPSNRPNTLVWLVVQEELGERELFNPLNDFSTEVLELVQSEAQVRGLPLFVPLMDLQDQQALRADTLWSLNAAEIVAASSRYDAESIIALRVYRSLSGEIIAKSVYMFRGQVQENDFFELGLKDLVSESVNLAAEELSGQYSILISANNAGVQVSLRVEGIKNSKDYADLINFVSTLTDVNDYQVSRVQQQSIVLTLFTGGQLRQLVERIALEDKLRPLAEISRSAQGMQMTYEWLD